MAYRGQGQKVQKVMVQPINLIFRYLQNRSRIRVWLYEQVNMRTEGSIIGLGSCRRMLLLKIYFFVSVALAVAGGVCVMVPFTVQVLLLLAAGPLQRTHVGGPAR
uniref:Uncharacterized protein n=1 Tax=Bos indicus x Bos taurus TaxID=30522 RepID=A0A4W2G840_BOBOX